MSLPDRSGPVLVATAVFLGLATLFTALRCVSKFGIRKRVDIDDIVTILAWLFTVALCIAIIFGTTVGVGKPDDLIQGWMRGPLKKSVYVYPMFYHLSSMLAKTATLLLYIRMAQAHASLRYASYAVLVVVDVAGIVLVFLNIFQCRPVHAAWTPGIEGQCFDNVILFLASAPINILSDMAILMLPLPIITELRMERRAKIGLVLTFMCGVFVAAVDVVRIAFLQKTLREQIELGSDHVSATFRPINYFWMGAWGEMWAAIECCVRVCCACALVLKPLLQRLKAHSKVLSSGSRQSPERSKHMHNSALHSGNGHDGTGPGSEFSFGSGKEPQSPRNLPLEAILETAPDVPDEDTMDIMAFFAAGPPGGGMPKNGIASGLGMMSTGFGNGLHQPPAHDSPASSNTLNGNPLLKQTTRLSTRALHRLSAPVRWITNESVPAEYRDQTTQHFFDFVQMGGSKPLTELTAREAWWPVLFVSILFFLWGFSYGLLGNLTGKIVEIIGASPTRSLVLQVSYWIGYVVAPATVGHYVLSRHGFKATFMAGLVIYGCGCMCFWPSSVLVSYGGFIFSNMLTAGGLAVLEVAANPFIALAGPGELSEARLNFSQGIQAIGSLFSPILAQRGLFRSVKGRVSLFDLQWCYLAVSLFVLLLTLVFFYVPLSEATDDELAEETDRRLANAGLSYDAKAFGVNARSFIIVAGVATMAVYIGQQESLAFYWNAYISEVLPKTDAFWDLSIGHGLFAAGRFLASGVCYVGFTPRFVLNVCCAGTFITTVLAVVLPNGRGAFACALLAMFFEAPVFPTLFAIALRGQGRNTKVASVWLTVSIGLGAVIFEPATFGIDKRTRSVRTSFILIAVLCGIQMIYPALLASRPVLRRMVDPKWSRGGPRRVSSDTFGSTEKGHVTVNGVPTPPSPGGSGAGPVINVAGTHTPPAVAGAGPDSEYLGLMGDLADIGPGDEAPAPISPSVSAQRRASAVSAMGLGLPSASTSGAGERRPSTASGLNVPFERRPSERRSSERRRRPSAISIVPPEPAARRESIARARTRTPPPLAPDNARRESLARARTRTPPPVANAGPDAEFYGLVGDLPEIKM